MLSERPPLQLAPVYDMLPMAYRPGAENMLPGLSDEALTMARSELAATPERELAAKFWRLVSSALHVSESFRKIASAHAAALSA
jgi:serine/threonine protein kinase HipA of HipAB toxin-antitoxin module